ncbi:hypothetical protein Tco_0429819 [Tanacetum coccineum]
MLEDFTLTVEDFLSCVLKEQLLEPTLNLTVHCYGLEFRVLNGYDQKSFDEERGLNCVVQTSWQLQLLLFLLILRMRVWDHTALMQRVMLFGDIPTVIPSTSLVAPETSTIAPVISPAARVVETTLVASPTGLCGLIPYSDSDSDSPDEMSSPEHISPLPSISPFLCTDSSEAPDSSDGPPSQDPYVMTVAHWRSTVASRPSSSFEFPIALITALPRIHRRSAILIRPGKAILFGRPYRTHLNGPRKLLTTRKRVGPLPAHRLAWRYASPRSSDHRPSSSSSSLDSFQVHSSGLDALDQAHSGSLTRDVSPRLESSLGDSSERPLHSSSHSARASRKRCRSPIDSVPSSIPVMGSLAPTHADLLSPHKRFRDSYSSEASIEEDTEVDPIETEVDMELGIGDGDDVRDHVENYTKGRQG